LPKKLSTEDILKRLQGTEYVLIGNYTSCRLPILLKHISCGYEWNAYIHNIIRGNGCPQCSFDKKRLSLDEVKNRFKKAGFELLGEYTNNRTPALVKHLNCNRIWKAVPLHIFRGKGCRPCSINDQRLPNEMVKEKLYHLGYEMLGEYKNVNTPILLKHIICGNEWSPVISNIFAGCGCPQCARSVNEKLTGKLLQSAGFNFEAQKKIQIERKKIRVDYYLAEINIIIEYNGGQHYNPVCFNGISQEEAERKFIKQQLRDQLLSQYCIDNNIIIIWIDGRKYRGTKLKIFMEEIILPQLHKTRSLIKE
jgi:hypothetical protein